MSASRLRRLSALFITLAGAAWAAEVRHLGQIPLAFSASEEGQFSARGRNHAIELTPGGAFLIFEKDTLSLQVKG